jgi:hypothetical protein
MEAEIFRRVVPRVCLSVNRFQDLLLLGKKRFFPLRSQGPDPGAWRCGFLIVAGGALTGVALLQNGLVVLEPQ